jgi:hypothetical protein
MAPEEIGVRAELPGVLFSRKNALEKPQTRNWKANAPVSADMRHHDAASRAICDKMTHTKVRGFAADSLIFGFSSRQTKRPGRKSP